MDNSESTQKALVSGTMLSPKCTKKYKTPALLVVVHWSILISPFLTGRLLRLSSKSKMDSKLWGN